MARSNALDVDVRWASLLDDDEADDPEWFCSARDVVEGSGAGALFGEGEGGLGGKTGGFDGEFVDISLRGPLLWTDVIGGSSEASFFSFD